MNLHITISTPLYLDRMVAKQNVKKSDLPKTSLKAKNTKKTRNNAKGEKIHKVVYTIPAEHVSGPRQSKVKYVSGDKTKREMCIENRRKRKSVLQTYKRPCDAKAENLANMVVELNAQEFFATVTYILDIVSWIIDAKALNAQQKHIAQIEEQTNAFAAQVKAYDYFAQGRAIDSDNAQFLHDMKYGLKYAKYAMAKAQNLKQLVAELESSDNDAHNAYKTMFDTMCWVSEMKEYEEHQQQIDQVKENIRLSLKAYEYVNKGKEKDEQDAKLLLDKSCGKIEKDSYNIFGMSDDIKEIAMQCLDKTLSQQRIATMVKQFVQSRTCVPVFDSTKNIEQSVLQFDASDVVDDLTVQCIDKTLSRQNIKTKMHQLSHVRTK